MAGTTKWIINYSKMMLYCVQSVGRNINSTRPKWGQFVIAITKESLFVLDLER